MQGQASSIQTLSKVASQKPCYSAHILDLRMEALIILSHAQLAKNQSCQDQTCLCGRLWNPVQCEGMLGSPLDPLVSEPSLTAWKIEITAAVYFP